MLTSPSVDSPLHPKFPFLALLISGGHTLLLLALSHQNFRILASTVDEAVGATVDAAARAVRIRWNDRAPGAALEALARDGLPGLVEEEEVNEVMKAIKKPKKVLPGELRFSFAGIHSWMDRYVVEHGRVAVNPEGHKTSDSSSNSDQLEMPMQTRPHKVLHLPNVHRVALARALQDAVFSQLEEKVVLGLKWCSENRDAILQDRTSCSSNGSHSSGPAADVEEGLVRHVVVSGGVASNTLFRGR